MRVACRFTSLLLGYKGIPPDPMANIKEAVVDGKGTLIGAERQIFVTPSRLTVTLPEECCGKQRTE